MLIKLTRSYGVVNPTGGIVITINDSRKIEYKTVMKVKQAQQRMQEITNEYFARIAEQENAEHENTANQNPPAEEILAEKRALSVFERVALLILSVWLIRIKEA